MMTVREFSVSILAVFVFLFAAPTQSPAQFVTLEGEVLESSQIQTSVASCEHGQIVFHVAGLATGPWPAPFIEDGVIVFDGKTGQILRVDISFMIKGAEGPITGTKSLKADGVAECTISPIDFGKTFSARAVLTYDALINGTSDKGEAVLDLVGAIGSRGHLLGIRFSEVFDSSIFAPTLGKVTGGGSILQGDKGAGGVSFGFNAQSTDQGMKGSGVITDHQLGARIKILDVTFFSVEQSQAVFIGRAEVNNVLENYRIEVEDRSEPGTGFDAIRITTDTYGTGGTLTGGNIQVHK